jgi:hypothetical protein
VAQDRPRRDPLERRTIWVFALAVLSLVLPQWQLTLFGGPEWWNVVLWMSGDVAILLAVGAAGVALMPSSALMPRELDVRRTETMSLAIVLIWVGLALLLANISVIAIDAIGESEF